MIKQYTIGELINWIMANRKGCAFKDYSEELILEEIINSMKDNVFRYSQHPTTGELIGVVCGRKFVDKKIVYIYDILATMPGVVKEMLKDCFVIYPDYELHGVVANGRKRKFRDIGKLYRRMK